jgi:hypothetical protein
MDNDKAAAFFDASGSLKGSDFADYEFLVRATFKGTADNFEFSLPEAVEDETVYHMNYPSDLTITAIGDVANALSGFSLKFDIIKIKADDVQSVSPERNEELTIVDITAVKGFTIGDVKKFYVPTGATGKATGQLFGLVSSGSGTLITGEVDINPIVILDKYDHEITVKGYYNNKEVSIPDSYLTVTSEKLIFGIDGKVVETSPAALKWSDFYDVKTPNYLRKDASDTVKVTIKDEDGVGILDTLSKRITISDDEPGVTTIEVKDAVTLSPKNTVITVADIEDKIDLKVKDQYGVEMTETASYKIASIVPNADGYAENNFKVSKNDSEEVEIVGAERGDTFTLTVTVGGKSVDVKVTVGADENANITGSMNNYLNKLISGYIYEDENENKVVVEGLEKQRKDGLQ